MVIQCGFFDSVNRDRLYKAEDMTKPYEKLVSNGVFASPDGTPSDQLQVMAVSGGTMSVRVKAGRGIFKDKWLISDSDMTIVVPDSEVVLSRIDSVVVKIDTSESVRAGVIEIKKGTPMNNPNPPTMRRTATVHEYRLADIRVNPGVTQISQQNITDRRGSADCPWVTSLIQQVDTSTLFLQFSDAFDTWFANVKEELATSTLIRSYTNTYTTTVQDETQIPINISQYNEALDILQVYINGLMLVKNTDYTQAVNDSEKVTLTKPVDRGTPVSFVVYKSIDGSEAESVVSQVVELQDLVQTVKPTADNGSTKWSVSAGASVLTRFITAGRGWHSWYAPASATDMPEAVTCRMFGHLTSQSSGSQAGWVMALSSTGRVYSNYLDNGTWKGWNELTVSKNEATNPTGGAKLSITATNQNVLTQFANMGMGVHTIYTATGVQGTPKTGAFRFIGQLTGTGNGWIMGFGADGSVYSNYIVGGTWKGWRTIYDVDNSPLWTGQNFMNNYTVTPSKKLSECAHGWVLVWADYDDATSTPNQYNVVTQVVPKLNALGNAWNNTSFMCVLPTVVNTDGSYSLTVKQVYISDDKITGFAGNNVGALNRGVVLRAVYEY